MARQSRQRPKVRCDDCGRTYSSRPLDVIIIAGVALDVCSRCRANWSGTLDWLWGFGLTVVKVEQLPFDLFGPDFTERDGTNPPPRDF